MANLKPANQVISMDVYRLVTFVLLFGLAGSAFLVSKAEEPSQSAPDVVKAWKAPLGKPYWKGDCNGPYAPSWPTWAAICQYAPDAPGAEKRVVMPDSTLFLMAAPDLKKSNLVKSIPHTARFATRCRSNATGCWARFARPPAEPYFVLYESTGGNFCSYRIRIFGHAIAYDSPHVGEGIFQDHTFREVRCPRCISSAFVGDVDGDGLDELVLEEIVEQGMSNADAKWGAAWSNIKEEASSELSAKSTNRR